jgi:hypothetical protein
MTDLSIYFLYGFSESITIGLMKEKNSLDAEWIVQLADSIDLLDCNLIKDEIGLIRDLFLDYHHEGLSTILAIKKAIRVFHQFKTRI